MIPSTFRSLNLRTVAAFMAFTTLLAIYPVPGTIALRNVLVVLSLVLSWPGRSAWLIRLSDLRLPAVVLVLLTGWLLFQAIVFSPYKEIALGYIGGTWLRCCLMLLLGWQLWALIIPRLGGAMTSCCLVTACLIAVGWHSGKVLVDECIVFIQNGVFNFSITSRDIWSDTNNVFLAILLTDRICRAKGYQTMLLLPNIVSLAFLILALFDLYLLRTSNGTMVAMVQLLVTLLIYLQRLSAKTVGIFMVLVFAAGAFISTDPRLHRLGDTVPIAWNIDANEAAWLHNDLGSRPKTETGEIVEESTFLRVSWARAAFREILAQPLGYGFSHRAYGYAINQRYGTNYDLQSSHNGLLDFTLGAGIPGLLLWLGLAVCLMLYGWRSFYANGNTMGIALMLLVLDYTLRCAIDGHLAGARLEWFFLIAGILAIGTARLQKKDMV